MNKLEMLKALKQDLKANGFSYSLVGSYAINVKIADVVLTIESQKDGYGSFLKVEESGDTFDMFSSEKEFDNAHILSKKINTLKKQFQRLGY